MPIKRVRVHYRRFYRTSDPIISDLLSHSVKHALTHKIEGVSLESDVRLRTHSDGDYGSVILNGRFAAQNGDVYGELVRFHPDTNIPLLVQSSETISELEVREASKPNDAEVLRGMSFFLIRGDHIFVVEQDLTNPTFERYLRWLLCERTPVAIKNTRLQLIPQVLLDDSSGVLQEVSAIKLHPPALRFNDLNFETRDKFSKDTIISTDIIGVLKAAHFDTAVIERIAAQKDAAIQIQLNVTIKSGRSKLKIKGEEAMALLRNVPEDELIVVGDSVRKNRGVLERMSVQADIEQRGNILDRKAAWTALAEAAAKYRDAGLIE